MALGSIIGGTAHAADRADRLPDPTIALAADQNAKPGEKHVAIFAGGCFWCIEGVFRQLRGVTDATSGYAGGTKATANYEAVCSHTTDHAEAVRVTYDPAQISYGTLLRVFFTLHDPTTKDRQGPDSGRQYRSAIFYLNDEQKKVAEAYIKQLDATKIFPSPIVTTLEPLTPETFYPAEDYHQNYVSCHLSNPYVRFHALPMVQKVREDFKDKVKPAETQP
jgi:peptide-methionine (S)-S-oxide reductase